MASFATSGSGREGVSSSNITLGLKYTEKKHEDSNPAGDFREVSLQAEMPAKKTKVPRRILHFSDGTLEEYSTDEEDETDGDPKSPAVNPKTLTWLPWLWYYMVAVGSGALSVADTCGERLAWMFGITSPKYQYAIDEYHRLQKEEEEEREREERERQAEQKRLADEMLVMEGAVELNSQPCVSNQTVQAPQSEGTSQSVLKLSTDQQHQNSSSIPANQQKF